MRNYISALPVLLIVLLLFTSFYKKSGMVSIELLKKASPEGGNILTPYLTAMWRYGGSAATHSVSFNDKTIRYNRFGVPDNIEATVERSELIVKIH